MLRDKNLIPLSHQHQHALALCVRIDRASPVAGADLQEWQLEIARHFESEIRIHFATEEEVLFPATRKFRELTSVVEELISEHGELRVMFESAIDGKLSAEDLRTFANRLANHIRKEERHLFERLQQLMSPEDLTALGQKLNRALENVVPTCTVPNRKSQPRGAR
ncbi:MAG TPA: hemerythrin domain-containing protein [Candidatus Acidoferrales bacterium]|nr:hemerythrin domain-containing protein [Candidatus Acidoferrales bacterium]